MLSQASYLLRCACHLQTFAQSGDTSQLDMQQVMQLLSAAAATAAVRPQAPDAAARSTLQPWQELQQTLQSLPLDTCQLLVEEVLPSVSSGSAVAGSAAVQQGSEQLQGPARPALAYLLQETLQPKLLALQAAAPRSLLACLTSLGSHSSAVREVMVECLLAPLVVSEGLLPVHVQLLVKLAKDVKELQPRCE
jgi:hypothetical protein